MAFFICLIVYIAKITDSIDDVTCVFARLSNDLLNGYADTANVYPNVAIEFLGLYGLKDLFTAF